MSELRLEASKRAGRFSSFAEFHTQVVTAERDMYGWVDDKFYHLYPGGWLTDYTAQLKRDEEKMNRSSMSKGATMSDERYEVENNEIKDKLHDIGGRIHNALAESSMAGKMGFALFIFEFGDKGATFYLSDAQRDDMLKVLEEFIAKQKE